jgi:two-component system cell cycle response regulator
VSDRRQAETLPAAVRPEPLPTFEDSCLVVMDGPRLGQCVHVHEVPVVIGRSAEADFRIDHPSVSRLHCSVWQEVFGASVRDLGSKNGVLVNGTRVRVAPLSDGDYLAVGDVVLKFMAGGGMDARYHEALFGLANLDSLTQLLNRRAFREALDSAVAATISDPEPLSVAIFDLDHFKQINDVLGHDAGDAALRRLSTLLRQALRERDQAGRLGGDEFAVLLPRTGPSEAHVWCESLRRSIDGLGLADGGLPQRVSISLGVATWEPAMGSAHEFLRLADKALLRAKAAGRDCTRPAIMGE